MKVLDRYILGTLLVSFLICLIGVLSLYILIDCFERLPDFQDYVREQEGAGGGAPLLLLVFQYYIVRTPLIYVQVGPVIMLLASMFTMTRMARHNELIPLHATGISFYRVVQPHLVFAVGCALSMIAVQETVLPALAERIEQASVISEGDQHELWATQVFDDTGRVYFFGTVSPFKATVADVRIIERYPDGRRAAEIVARTGRLTQAPGGLALILGHGEVRRFHQDRLSFLPGYPRRFGAGGYHLVTGLTLKGLFGEDKVDIEFASSTAMLQERLARDPQRFDLRMSMHLRFSLPIAALVLLTLGLPLVVGRESRNMFIGVGFCILIAAGFYVALFVTINLGNKGLLNPLVAAWGPLILFGSLGAALLDGVRT